MDYYFVTTIIITVHSRRLANGNFSFHRQYPEVGDLRGGE